MYWIFNKLAQTHLYKVCADTNCAGTQIAASQYYYDGATSVTTSPIFGQLTKQIDGMADTQTTTQYTYWSDGSYTGNGNLRQVSDDKGRTTETFYDSRFPGVSGLREERQGPDDQATVLRRARLYRRWLHDDRRRCGLEWDDTGGRPLLRPVTG